jgi:hypothetical protein
MNVPRGIRNFNPGNIRRDGTPWLGLADDQSDPEFCVFTDPEHGIRAIVKIMRSYKARGLYTIKQAIARWAPPVENDTSAYVDAVCAGCNVFPDTVVDFDEIMPQLVKAIIQHENGQQPYTDQTINAGIALA